MGRNKDNADPEFNEFDLIASICRESFFEFVKEFWSVIIPQKPVWNWHIKYLCDSLQRIAERVFKNQPCEEDLIVNISPATSKSTIFSVMFQGWVWTRMPTARFICGSHTDSLVLALSLKARDIVVSDKYKKCFPEIVLRSDQEAKGYWVNTLGGDRFCCTVGGKTPTGMHGHFLIIDDPIDPEKVLSEAEVTNANNWMTVTLPSRKVDINVSVTILVMQRFHDNDPTGYLLDNPGTKIKHFCFPAELTEDVKPEECRKFYVDDLFDPIRLPRAKLDVIKLKGRLAFSGQYGQRPIPPGGVLFKKEWFTKFVEVLPSDFRWIRSWDKAGTEGSGCYTCGTLIGTDDNGKFCIGGEVRGQWEHAERNEIIRATAKLDGFDVEITCEQEPGSGGKESAEISVKELAGYRINVDKVITNKIARADAFAAQCKAGNVMLLLADWTKDWIDEVCTFPLGKRKDRVDSTTGGFNRLILSSRIDLHKSLDNMIAVLNYKTPVKTHIMENDEVGVKWIPTYEEWYVWQIRDGVKKILFTTALESEAYAASSLLGLDIDSKLAEEVSIHRRTEIEDILGLKILSFSKAS